MNDREKTPGTRALRMTRTALAAIEHEHIRKDLERFVDGAEKCLAADEIVLALDAVRTVVTTVVALDRTLGHDVAIGILDGLRLDSQETAVALQRGLGYTSKDNSKCDIRPGTPIGSSSCAAAKNSTCYTLDSGSGCGSSSTRFQFVWEDAMVEI